MALPKLDWNVVEAEYVSGDMSLKDLAEKHGVDEATMESHSAKDGWKEKRKEFRGKSQEILAQKVFEKEAVSLEHTADTISAERARLIKVVDAMIGRGIKQMVGERDAQGNMIMPPTMKVTARDLLDGVKLKLVLSGETIERSEIKGMGVQAIQINFIQKQSDEPGLKSDDRVVEQATPTRPEQ